MGVMVDSEWLRLAEACAIGLLIGVERERNKDLGPHRGPAGIRTFGAAALAGALSEMLGGALLLSALALGSAALLVVGYYRTTTDDPGLTTEIALLTTLLLGGLTMRNPSLAGACGVGLAILLASIEHRLQNYCSGGKWRIKFRRTIPGLALSVLAAWVAAGLESLWH